MVPLPFLITLDQHSPQSLKNLIDRPDEPHTFRLIKDRVYYLSESAMRFATNIGREQLISIGNSSAKLQLVYSYVKM